jgi:hypothetical protein
LQAAKQASVITAEEQAGDNVIHIRSLANVKVKIVFRIFTQIKFRDSNHSVLSPVPHKAELIYIYKTASLSLSLSLSLPLSLSLSLSLFLGNVYIIG